MFDDLQTVQRIDLINLLSQIILRLRLANGQWQLDWSRELGIWL